jgi:ferric iron reductase protein FhuF
LAPAIGAIALGHSQASLSLDHLWWQNEVGGPYPLSITPRSTTEVPGVASAVDAITAAIAERYAVSHRVLWGNVGSASNSAAQQISTARADLAITAHAAADAILTDSRVDGGVLRAGPPFRRRSCCLIYRLAHDRAAVCGDCVLGSGVRVAYGSP